MGEHVLPATPFRPATLEWVVAGPHVDLAWIRRDNRRARTTTYEVNAMRSAVVFISVLLLCVGIPLALVGRMWQKGQRLLRVFLEVEMNDATGSRMFWIGAGMTAFGIYLMCLIKN